MGTCEKIFFVNKGSLDGSGSKSNELIETETTTIDDLIEIIIFSLSPVLGGRSEVMATPLIEVLGHVERHKTKRQMDRWNSFMDTFYATQKHIKKQDRQKYIDTIKPVVSRMKGIKPPKQTDLSMLQRMKDAQKNRTGG